MYCSQTTVLVKGISFCGGMRNAAAYSQVRVPHVTVFWRLRIRTRLHTPATKVKIQPNRAVLEAVVMFTAANAFSALLTMLNRSTSYFHRSGIFAQYLCHNHPQEQEIHTPSVHPETRHGLAW